MKENKNIDNLFQAMNEDLNHSKYIANEVIQIEKYISEKQHGIINTIAGALNGECHLLIAPTGSGKSYSVIDKLKNLGTKALFILPNSANVQQAMEEYSISGAYGDLSSIASLEDGDIVVMTWDKASQLQDTDISEYIIVIDEIHQTYTDTYRNKAIKGLYEISKKCKGRIDITATPNKLDFSIYDYIVEYQQANQTKYNVKLYNEIDIKTIINILNNANNGALLLNDTNELKYISSNLHKKHDIITSQIKEYSQLYSYIMQDSNMGDFEIMLNTTTIVAGVNIKNPNITDVILVGIKDVGTIKQYVARFRELKQCNIHIFNNYKDKCNVYDVEWLVNKNIEKAEIIKNAYNIACKDNTEFSTLGININPINLDANIYFNKDTNNYEVDKIYIRSQVYRKYYNSRTIESFKILLSEYFKNVEIVENITIDEKVKTNLIKHKKKLKEKKKDAIEQLEKHKNILVGYEDIKKDKRSFALMDYQNTSGLTMEQCKKDYLKYEIHDLILNNSLKSTINLYSKNVLENNFSTDLSWKLANMGNRKRGSIFAKINTLIYRELKEEYSNIFKNDYSVEVRVFEWLVNEFKEGTSYTSEHLEILSESFIMTFGDNWSLSTKKISEILNQTYNIDKVKNKKLTSVETLFYRNIIPTEVKNDKINYNTIKSRIELSDIKADLKINSSDRSLENFIIDRKQKILNQLDSIEKEILLEGLF